MKQLASDEMQGRRPGTEGYDKAAKYVSEEFQRLGIRPGNGVSFRQPVGLEVRTLREERSSLELARDGTVIPLRFGIEAILFPAGETGQRVEADIVFAGYGLTIKEYGHDDFNSLDVAGKVVAFLSGAPPSVPSAVAAHYSSMEQRLQNLQRLGATGALPIVNPRLREIPWQRLSAMRGQLIRAVDLIDRDLRIFGRSHFAALVNDQYAPQLLGISESEFADILKLDSDKKPLPRFAVRGTLRATAAYDRTEIASDNIVAIIPGRDPTLAREYVLLSAHLDHLGAGPPVDGDAIYNGAMDNSSGVAALLEVARMLAAAEERPRRSILFLASTGEEDGLLGSKYFANRPTVPITDVVANINLDMFMPIIPIQIVRGYGVGESDLSVHLAAAAQRLGISVQDDPEPERNIFIRSDQYSFIKKGVPALFLSVGFEPGSAEHDLSTKWFRERYHSPSDDVNQPVNLETAARFNNLMRALTVAIANADRRPDWNDRSFFRTFRQ